MLPGWDWSAGRREAAFGLMRESLEGLEAHLALGDIWLAQQQEELAISWASFHAAVKAHRLVAFANQMGVVKISIDGDVTECVRLEGRVAGEFGLAAVRVVPDLGETGLPLRALRVAGSGFLLQEIDALLDGSALVRRGGGGARPRGRGDRGRAREPRGRRLSRAQRPTA